MSFDSISYEEDFEVDNDEAGKDLNKKQKSNQINIGNRSEGLIDTLTEDNQGLETIELQQSIKIQKSQSQKGQYIQIEKPIRLNEPYNYQEKVEVSGEAEKEAERLKQSHKLKNPTEQKSLQIKEDDQQKEKEELQKQRQSINNNKNNSIHNEKELIQQKEEILQSDLIRQMKNFQIKKLNIRLRETNMKFREKQLQFKKVVKITTCAIKKKDQQIENLNQALEQNQEQEKINVITKNSFQEEINKLKGEISKRDEEIQSLKETNKDDEKLKLDFENHIKAQEELSEKYQQYIVNNIQQAQPLDHTQLLLFNNQRFTSHYQREFVDTRAQFYQSGVQMQDNNVYQNNFQMNQSGSDFHLMQQSTASQDQHQQQQVQLNVEQENYQKANVPISCQPEQNMDNSSEFFSLLIKEKYLKNNVPFFQNPVTVEEILNKEYSGNQQKRIELNQLFQERNIQWVSIVRGDGNCFFRSFFIEYLLIKMIDFTSAANFPQEIKQFLKGIQKIKICIPTGLKDFFGEKVDIKNLIQFAVKDFRSKIQNFKQQSAVFSLFQSFNDPIFDLAMQIIFKSMIIQAAEEIKEKQIYPLVEFIGVSSIRKSISQFNTESGSSEILSCLSTYLQRQILLLNCINEKNYVFDTYEPFPGIPESPLMFQTKEQDLSSLSSSLALWLKTGHYYILYSQELANKINQIIQNSTH